MKKLFAILTATLVVCGLCVAPAFAAEHAPLPDHPYYPTEVTDIDGFDPPYDKLVLGHEDFMEAVGILVPDPGYPDDYYGGVCGGNTNREMPKPNPDEKYVMLLDGTITTTKTDVVVDPDLVPTEVVDIQWEATDDGTPGAVMAVAIDEETAKQAAEDEFNKNHSTDGAVVTDSDSGYYPPERTEVLVKEAWDETVEHEAGWIHGGSEADFTAPESATILLKQASQYVAIWSANEIDFQAAYNYAKSKDKSLGAYNEDANMVGYGSYDLSFLGNQWGTYNFSHEGNMVHFNCDEQRLSHADRWWAAWTETIHHDAQYETIYYPGAGWANIVYLIPNDEPTPVPPTPVDPDPVIPDPEPVDPDPEPIAPEPETVVINDDVTPVSYSDSGSYLPKTGDTFGDMDSIIAIITAACLAILFLELCRKAEEKTEVR